MKYQKIQEEKQKSYFPKDKLGGKFGSKPYDFVLKDYKDNFTYKRRLCTKVFQRQ